jgi:hypothetical protein
MSLLGAALLWTGFVILIAVAYTRWVIGDTRPGRECVKCGERAVFGKDQHCTACGAFQRLKRGF